MDERISYAGQMSKLTSRAQWILLVLAAANGGFLYFLPGLAERDYAWAIKPPINAAFMGAGYLAGLVAAVLGTYCARRWRSVRMLLWPFVLLGVVMSLATWLHAERFRWSYSLTWLWTLVYLGIPPVALFLWRREEHKPRALADQDSGLVPMRLAASLLGSALITLSAILFFAPAVAQGLWPWQITPLIARVFAAWHLLMGGILLFSALGARRVHELPIPFLTVFTWSLLLCVLPLLYRSNFTPGGSAAPWIGFQLTILLFTGAVTVRALRAMRAAGQAL
jgi:hypothetical protein